MGKYCQKDEYPMVHGDRLLFFTLISRLEQAVLEQHFVRRDYGNTCNERHNVLKIHSLYLKNNC